MAVVALHCGQLQADRLPPGSTAAFEKDAARGEEVHIELETEDVVGRHEFGPADAFGPLRIQGLKGILSGLPNSSVNSSAAKRWIAIAGSGVDDVLARSSSASKTALGKL